MTLEIFNVICNQIHKDAKKKNSQVVIVINFLASHGGYSASSAQYDKVFLDEMEVIEDSVLKFQLPIHESDNYGRKRETQICTVKDFTVEDCAYAYVPLTEINSLFLIK